MGFVLSQELSSVACSAVCHFVILLNPIFVRHFFVFNSRHDSFTRIPGTLQLDVRLW